MSGLVQIPFSAFKLIDFGQTVGLSVYQSLYTDHSEPVGLFSVIQAFGLIRPSDTAIEAFNQKWTRGSSRWKLHETGIEVVSGKSSTTGEMAKTREGESTLLALSFLIEALGVNMTADLARQIIDSTPDHLVPIKPRRAQVAKVVIAVESQTTCVSWQVEMDAAQESVLEKPVIWTSESVVPPASYNLPLDAKKAYYQVLCTVSRFPEDYHCTVKTTLSLSALFVLAHSICGLRVCVIVDDDVVFGNSATGSWHVLLQRIAPNIETTGSFKTEIRLGRKMDDVQDLLVLDEVGSLRANRITITGIARAATVGQGLSISEGDELAVLAIGVSTSILEKWKREVVDESGDEDETDVSFADSSTSSENLDGDDRNVENNFPVKTRIRAEVVSVWWGCPIKTAIELLKASERAISQQPEGASWSQLKFSKSIMGKIAEFEDLDEKEKLRRRERTNHALDRRDYSRVVHMLTSQLLLIAFLLFNDSSKDRVRVRSTCSPQNSEIGRSIRLLDKIQALRQSDLLYSWYYWLHGSPPSYPRRNYGLDVVATEGYLVYRSLLLDLSLNPESCEMVTVEPGHISMDNQRYSEVRGNSDGFFVLNIPHYRKTIKGPKKLRPEDHTGPLKLRWRTEEGDGNINLEMSLSSEQFGFDASASIYQIATESWKLCYGDRYIGCNHEEERVGTLADGESLDICSAGGLGEEAKSDPWKPLVVLSAHGNDRGQVACLLSAAEGWRGMVRREACLRCCVTTCLSKGLDFLID